MQARRNGPTFEGGVFKCISSINIFEFHRPLKGHIEIGRALVENATTPPSVTRPRLVNICNISNMSTHSFRGVHWCRLVLRLFMFTHKLGEHIIAVLPHPYTHWPLNCYHKAYKHISTLQWRHNGTVASQITSLTIVYSAVYSDADQRKLQSSASLAVVRGIHRGPGNSPHNWPVTRKMFPFDDVIMIHFHP